MKKLSVLFIILFTNTVAIAQPGHMREPIKALKIGYITEKVELTAKQAEKFWPVYNNYEEDLHQIRKKFFDKYRKENPDERDREQARAYIEANLDYQEQILNTKKEYQKKFLKVISEEQLADLYQAEAGFRTMLIKELRSRGKPHGGDGHKPTTH